MCFTEYDHVVQALPADPSRLEAIAHHADEKEGDCDHQRGSCSDSGTAANPADGVFGSDRLRSKFPRQKNRELFRPSREFWCRNSEFFRPKSKSPPDEV